MLLSHSLSVCMDCGEQTFDLRSHVERRHTPIRRKQMSEEPSKVDDMLDDIKKMAALAAEKLEDIANGKTTPDSNSVGSSCDSATDADYVDNSEDEEDAE